MLLLLMMMNIYSCYDDNDDDDIAYHDVALTYHTSDGSPSYSSSVEVSNMSIFQSVECPLTVKDTVIIGGNLQTRNGNGSGAFLATWRRLTSDKGWMEVGVDGSKGEGG